MTQARSMLIPPGHAVYAHVVTRCVRRAWLFGNDRLSNRRFDHRCAMAEGRVRMLAEIFGVGVYAFALMANHVHLVIEVSGTIFGAAAPGPAGVFSVWRWQLGWRVGWRGASGAGFGRLGVRLGLYGLSISVPTFRANLSIRDS